MSPGPGFTAAESQWFPEAQPQRDLAEHSGDLNGVPRPCPVAFPMRYPMDPALNICPSVARPSGRLPA